MAYNIDQAVIEIRKCNSTIGDLRREFQAFKDEIRQEIGEMKLMVERNTSTCYPIPQAPIYQSQPPLINPPVFESVCRDIPRFPESLGSGQHRNAECIEAFLRETMGLQNRPEDSKETIDDKRLLVKQYHSQLNRFTQVTCMNLATKLLADASIDKNKLSWKEIPGEYRNMAYKELEEFALRANIPLNRCVNSWGAQVLLAKTYNNYRNKKLKDKLSKAASNVVESNTHLTEKEVGVDPEENLGLELLPDLDAVSNIKEEENDEADVAISSALLSPCAVSSLPLSPSTRSLRTRSGTSSASRSNKKRKT
ncbi:hypothetical protein G6F62_002093 [Rhizopus arrhizus]|nr:hypothetical protein G6F62_002093 [Rhizopus arrhizus]KAG1376867.1 hypothetical protein G6F61_007234 [Rhizopus arrhizus]